ncbi:hypothetical protein J3Q64DRAFT_1764996 [Phycomyces blakesleeanus]|uniref:Uncharacterized protein n=2 Tax=Phycomyces blakesleeanus TaxID=4837 RepID=A0A162PWH7_PHYB8|nr:hypothetical protein PHYBLDRAFT_61155 [Phycomyces blakesleeanus NRRL 1555(-)]OAD74796.1 hypothetical protein PHYBLDRAFT_61155 [Phycomyces blakesleeanus NRRL 1555(-)]|eukprot:XP_018292836.1 hypothetical protein PHYBLDRAFT_61155 [Phycomyces blakesleeanus NRRL 1555(-)]
MLVFGSGMFSKDGVKLRGHRCGVVGKLYKVLKKQETEGQLIVITISEFKASKTCSLCFFGDKKIIKQNRLKVLPLYLENNNMISISKSIWSGEGRPDVFIPKKK